MPVRARMQAKQSNVACHYPNRSMLNDTDTCQAPRPSRSSLLRLLRCLRRHPTARPWTSRRCRTSNLISLPRSLFPRRRRRKHQVTCLRFRLICSRQASSQGHWQLHQHRWHLQASSKRQSKLCGAFQDSTSSYSRVLDVDDPSHDRHCPEPKVAQTPAFLRGPPLPRLSCRRFGSAMSQPPVSRARRRPLC